MMIGRAVVVVALAASPVAIGDAVAQEKAKTIRSTSSILSAESWGWDGTDQCSTSPQRIRFSEDGKRMHLSQYAEGENGKPGKRIETSYTVGGQSGDSLAMVMDNETRTDDAGRKISWNLILLDEESYCWQRSDWESTECTKLVRRCEVESKP
ncbi:MULTISPECIES: hypothetical protein [unclassified Lysobacter]|uniref:hypothetical protein n=1 Tax=unclassified Lysobacter TaxID=2635362 RepID=UPI0006FA9556|nr:MULTISPECIES: hypothetical protein [unclassified Lysobacter]KRA21167.1 hypothetical protein ASD69_07785 [Lysobacter sp. Root604]